MIAANSCTGFQHQQNSGIISSSCVWEGEKTNDRCLWCYHCKGYHTQVSMERWTGAQMEAKINSGYAFLLVISCTYRRKQLVYCQSCIQTMADVYKMLWCFNVSTQMQILQDRRLILSRLREEEGVCRNICPPTATHRTLKLKRENVMFIF